MLALHDTVTCSSHQKNIHRDNHFLKFPFEMPSAMYGFRVDFTVPPNWEYVEAGPASAPLCGELMRTVSFFLFFISFFTTLLLQSLCFFFCHSAVKTTNNLDFCSRIASACTHLNMIEKSRGKYTRKPQRSTIRRLEVIKNLLIKGRPIIVLLSSVQHYKNHATLLDTQLALDEHSVF